MKRSLRWKRHKVLCDLGLSFSNYEKTIDCLCSEVVRLQIEEEKLKKVQEELAKQIMNCPICPNAPSCLAALKIEEKEKALKSCKGNFKLVTSENVGLKRQISELARRLLNEQNSSLRLRKRVARFKDILESFLEEEE